MNRLARRAWFTMVLAGTLILGLLTIMVRYITESSDWVTFQNSPHVYNNGVMDCGVVLDRGGTVVLDATNGKSYADNETVRKAMLHVFGDTQGNIPAYLLDEYGDEMVGFDLLNGTYHSAEHGGQMRLTLSADVQHAALDAMGSYKGAIGVYNYKTGEILCMISTPTFDPNSPPDVQSDPERYEGVYVNRFLHAAYTPGSTFKLITAAAALEEIPDLRERTFYCAGQEEIGGETVVCNGVHGTVNFEEALAHSCNVVFGEIAAELGADVLSEYAEQIGIMDSLTFDGFITRRGSFDLSSATTYETAWAGIGQYTDQINLCQYMTYMGAIANGGVAAQPYLVESVTFGEQEKYSAETELLPRALEEDTANELAEMMHYAVVNQYGDWYFSGLYAGAKSGTAERGEGMAANALFVGFTQDADYPLAFVMVLEGGNAGSSVCTPVVSQVLNACVVAMQQTS